MGKATSDALETYRRKRDFSQTPEPDGASTRKGAPAKRGKPAKLSFVIQKHEATRLHYDFRLELGGVLKSWAVTKGPSLNPADKRLAVRTEDHPLAYGAFEGVIPRGYGAGTVMLWDQGEWVPNGDPEEGLKRGSLKFELKGERLRGGWALVRMNDAKARPGKENWLLIKERDDVADDTFNPLTSWTDSITTGRGFEEIRRRTKPAKSAASSTKQVRFPPFVEPQLATLRDMPPSGPEWVHELKLDGYRIQALVAGKRVKLVTRNGKDWTARYPSVAEALSELDVESATLDGELVALGNDGRSDFSALQAATEDGSDRALTLFAFDLLSLNGENIQRRPLIARKSALQSLLAGSGSVVRYSDHVTGTGDGVIAKACALGLEGIISKKCAAAYRSGRSTVWVKSKCIGRSEFVVGGYRRSGKKGRAFSSLLVGEYMDGRLHYRGRVGTGFSDAVLEKLIDRMSAIERKTPAFEGLTPAARREAVWVKPQLVAEVSYPGRTAGGLLRHAAFLGLREDKSAEEVEAETEAGASEASADGDAAAAGVRISSPNRAVFENGISKLEVARYVAEFAPRMLPFLKNHPVSLVRCPAGLAEDCFFQKHVKDSSPPEFSQASILQGNGKKADYILLNSAQALVAAIQIGAIEFHPWGAAADRLEQPDRLVIDLDPDGDLPFSDVRAAAFEVRDVLSAAGLQSFALLTGGKGIHVIAPLDRRRTWTDVKAAARGLARQMAAARPELYVSEMSKKKRAGRIFIDWLRNERGATAVCPYSLRARPSAPLATPVGWEELPRIAAANTYTLANIRQRMRRLRQDPWEGYHAVRQSLSASVLTFLSD